MATQVSYPGVYIEEFAPGAPIQGAGTSTAAFLGPSASGPLNLPVRITSWDAFRTLFGSTPLANFYLWYAVRGFFENGGQVCYVTRVSNAAHDELVLLDGNGDATIRLRAREAGDIADPISAEVAAVSLLDPATSRLFRPTATVSSAVGSVVTVTNPAEAARFVPGDVVTITGTTVRETVTRVDGAVLRLGRALGAAVNAGTLHLASLVNADTAFRVEGPGVPEPGAVLQLDQAGTQAAGTVASVRAERITPALTTYRVTLEQPIGVAFDLTPAGDPVTVQSFEFRLTVTQGGQTFEHDNLAMNPAHPRYFANIVSNHEGTPLTAEPVEPPNTAAAPQNVPAILAAAELTDGTNDDPATLSGADYTAALALHEALQNVNMLIIPDRAGDMGVQVAMIGHAERLRRFAILGAPRGAPPFGAGSVEEMSASVTSARGYAALYYPWLRVPPATGNTPILVPPMGHMAGILARTDTNRGVHKAPAGEEATVNGALGVERDMSDIDQGLLNLGQFAGIGGINVIRVFRPGGRPVVWGARTTATDRNWQYVNIRRLFLYLEESIEEGIRWAVFEPNNLQLWQKLKRTISEFLMRAWRDGALFGAKAEEAFYVRIDGTLNPFSEQALGRLNIEIGVRPTYPAEFIVVRIGIWAGGSEVTEG